MTGLFVSQSADLLVERNVFTDIGNELGVLRQESMNVILQDTMVSYNWILKVTRTLRSPTTILMEVASPGTGAPVQYFPKEE